MRPVTIRAVAERAGVHVSTASRSLDPAQHGRITEATAERVRVAARELGYVPDLVAVGLKRGRTTTVGIVVADLLNPFIGPLLRGVSSAVEEQGYIPLIAETVESSARFEQVLSHLLSRRVDAIITTAVHANDAPLVQAVARLSIPIVLAVRSIADARFSAVLHDELSGGRMAAEHLVGLGHSVVAQLPGPEDIDTFNRRRLGFAQALRGADVTDVTRPEFGRSSTLEEGRRLMRVLLQATDPPPTAVFAANDVMAVGAMEAMEERGLSCPHDISIVGYNDVPLSSHTSPPLTTIRLPSEELGRCAGEMALRLVSSPSLEPETLRLPATLVVRKSTASPPI